MKKFIAVLAIAGFIASCNNATEAPATPNADSAAAAATAVDTTKAAADTTKAADTTAPVAADTTKK